ncbi:MAG TPA: alpha/beta hydrolase [Planktothrix sp.]|jgi:acetyl esterase
MTDKTPAEPLYELIRRIRRPATLREMMAACLRSVHMGDPFSCDEGGLPPMPQELIDQVMVSDTTIEDVRCAVYRPKVHNSACPLILYMHGGGFVVGCSEDTEYITRKLCHSNQAVVVSVNYRLAPETPYPGALDDCEKVLRAVIDAADKLQIDASSIHFAGDSAGGNLALALGLKLADALPLKGLILLAPWLDMEMEKYESYNRLAPTGIVFDAAFLAYCRASYVGFSDWKNPLVSPLHASLENLPPTIAFIGTEDSLLDQVLQFKAKAAQIEVIVYPGMPHCFYTFPHLFDEEQDCFSRITAFIRSSL